MKRFPWLWLFLIFWLVNWIFLAWPLRTAVVPPAVFPGVMGPLTTPQKILLGYRLEINTLGESDWESLPGIGPALAERIVAHRKNHGPFHSLKDLDAVPGIGPKILQSLHRQFFDASDSSNFSF